MCLQKMINQRLLFDRQIDELHSETFWVMWAGDLLFVVNPDHLSRGLGIVVTVGQHQCQHHPVLDTDRIGTDNIDSMGANIQSIATDNPLPQSS